MKFKILNVLVALVLFSCSKEELFTGDQQIESPSEDYSFVEPEVTGNTFYIDPVNGSDDGNGSNEQPWKTLQHVLESGKVQYYKHSEPYDTSSALIPVNENAPVKGGDELVLRSGYHGYINMNNFMFKEKWITIRGEEGQYPTLSQFKLIGAFKNIYLKNVNIIKSSYQGNENYWETEVLNRNNRGNIVHLESNGFHGRGSSVKFKNVTVKTAENTSSWTAREWLDKSASGFYLRTVESIEIIDSTIENVAMGVSVDYESNHFAIINSEILSFSHDGMRLCSNNIKCYNNKIIGCVDVDSELPEYRHYDGIQSYARGENNRPGEGTLENVFIKNNLIAMIPKGSTKKHGNLQGIGCFDGFFKNWIIENNIVLTDNYHGIAMYGLLDGKILNNTVVDQLDGNDRSPWIVIKNHKTRGVSQNSIIANNLVSRSISYDPESINVTSENNYIIGRDQFSLLQEIFMDLDDFNMNLKINDFTKEHIIDKGKNYTNAYSSQWDFNQRSRDNSPDLGALESQN